MMHVVLWDYIFYCFSFRTDYQLNTSTIRRVSQMAHKTKLKKRNQEEAAPQEKENSYFNCDD